MVVMALGTPGAGSAAGTRSPVIDGVQSRVITAIEGQDCLERRV
jgi:hypothetical protein